MESPRPHPYRTLILTGILESEGGPFIPWDHYTGGPIFGFYFVTNETSEGWIWDKIVGWRKKTVSLFGAAKTASAGKEQTNSLDSVIEELRSISARSRTLGIDVKFTVSVTNNL